MCLYINFTMSLCKPEMKLCVCVCTYTTAYELIFCSVPRYFLLFQYECQVAVLLRTISLYNVIFTYYGLLTTVHRFNLCHCLWVETNAKLCTWCRNQINECIILIHLKISHLTVPPLNIARFSNIERALSLLLQPTARKSCLKALYTHKKAGLGLQHHTL
jgi:hypothetical protein